MKRHDDSQRSGRWPVMFGDVRVVDRLVASIASLPGLGRRMPMKRHDDSQRSGRLAMTQPVYPTCWIPRSFVSGFADCFAGRRLGFLGECPCSGGLSRCGRQHISGDFQQHKLSDDKGRGSDDNDYPRPLCISLPPEVLHEGDNGRCPQGIKAVERSLDAVGVLNQLFPRRTSCPKKL